MLNDVWVDLEGAQASDLHGWLSKRVLKNSPCDMFAALSEPDRMRALLLEVSADVVPPIAEYPSADGFIVFPESVIAGPNGKVRLCLQITNNTYSEMFAVLADDVAETVSATKDRQSGVRAFLGKLNAWQMFLRRHMDGLSIEEQKGLFAELQFLDSFLLKRLPVHDAIHSWIGPGGGVRDFVCGECQIEVKAATASQNGVFHVPNLAQLDETTASPLLVYMAILASFSSGRTLPDLVNDVSGRIAREDPTALALLADRLLQAGYHSVHASRYISCWHLQEERFYRVEGGFPRILEPDLRKGVRSASYTVRIADCAPYEISVEEAVKNILEDQEQNGA